MALDKNSLQANTQSAFQQQSWESCASLLASAIDNYLMSGEVNVTITATVTPPLPAISYVVSDTGKGTITTTASSVFATSLISSFQQDSWSTVSPIISSALANLVVTATTAITFSPEDGSLILTGTGSGTFTTTGDSLLESQLNAAFSTGTSWETVTDLLATAIETYVKTITVSATATGVVPINSWTGTGSGIII